MRTLTVTTLVASLAMMGCGAGEDLGPAPMRVESRSAKADGQPMFWEGYWNARGEMVLLQVDGEGRVQGSLEFLSEPATETEARRTIIRINATDQLVFHADSGVLLSRPESLDAAEKDLLASLGIDFEGTADAASKADLSWCDTAELARNAMTIACNVALMDPTDSLQAYQCEAQRQSWAMASEECIKQRAAEAQRKIAEQQKQMEKQLAEQQKKIEAAIAKQQAEMDKQMNAAQQKAAAAAASKQTTAKQTIVIERQACAAPLSEYLCVDITEATVCKGGANTVGGLCPGGANIRCCVPPSPAGTSRDDYNGQFGSYPSE